MSLRELDRRISQKQATVAVSVPAPNPSTTATEDNAGVPTNVLNNNNSNGDSLMVSRGSSILSVDDATASPAARLAKHDHLICEKVFGMIILQAGLYSCSLVQIAKSSVPAMLWGFLGLASFLLVVQLIYLLAFYRSKSKGLVEPNVTHIVALSVAPIVVLASTWVYTFGVLETFIEVLTTNSVPTHAWFSNDIAVFASRSCVYFMLVIACLYSFISSLNEVAKRAGEHEGLCGLCLPSWEAIEGPDESVVAVGGGGQEMTNITTTTTTTTNVIQNTTTTPADIPPHNDNTIMTVFITIAQAAMVGLQVPSGIEGHFRMLFLAMFGVGCFLLAFLLCHVFLIQATTGSPWKLLSDDDQSAITTAGLIRIFTAMPLTVILINTWCYCTQVVEFFLLSFTNVFSLDDVISKMLPIDVLLFVLMTVFYVLLVLLSVFVTRSHLVLFVKRSL